MAIEAGTSTYYQAKRGIVQDGLVLHLDAGVKESYGGAGNTWYDLSGNNRHGTIYPRTDGFTDHGYYMSFPDNSTYPASPARYAYVQTSIPTGGYSYTASLYVRVYNASRYNHIVRTANNFGVSSTSTGQIECFTTNYNVEVLRTSTGIISSNNWFMVDLVYDYENMTHTIYHNGQLSVSKNHSQQYSLGTGYIRWLSRDDAYLNGLNGDCGMIIFYDKPLSANEVQQNFNATRHRFGL